MTTRIALSTASERTRPPAISALMQMALAQPGLISLAAGFVDQGSLPVDAAARTVVGLADDAPEGRRAPGLGRPPLVGAVASDLRAGGRSLPRADVRRVRAAERLAKRPRRRDGDPRADVQQDFQPGPQGGLRRAPDGAGGPGAAAQG